MYRSKARAVFVNLLRYWLVISTILFLGLAIAAQPQAWAAPVPVSKNQTVPPGQTIPPVDFLFYLPQIKLID
jgi:hypothetical protein